MKFLKELKIDTRITAIMSLLFFVVSVVGLQCKIFMVKQEVIQCNKAIELSAEGWFYIICFNTQEANRVFYLSKVMGFQIPQPITIKEFIDGAFYPQGIKGFIIDNLESLLHELSRGVPIKAITINKET
jgi:hypothetical protein